MTVEVGVSVVPNADDLDRIRLDVTDGLANLTPETAKAVRIRIERQSRLWAAGELGPIKDLADVARTFGRKVPEEQAKLLELVRVRRDRRKRRGDGDDGADAVRLHVAAA